MKHTQHRFNSGRWMASRTQSDYGTLRQRIIANPGIASSTVSSESGSPAPVNEYAPRKHCPTCARNLFHTTLFDYSWLTQCPIHGDTLETHCPECGDRWPRSADLAQRCCPSCGIPTWEDLVKVKRPYPSELLKIERLQEFTTDSSALVEGAGQQFEFFDLAGAFFWDSTFRRSWTIYVTPENPYFPAFQLVIHPDFSRGELEALGVKVPHLPVELLETPLRMVTRHLPPKQSWYSRLRASGPIRRPSVSAMKVIESSFNQILGWIHRNSPKNHRLMLGDYRSYGFRGLVDSHVHFCPYCFGVSAWFDAVTQKYFGPWQCSLPIEYFWTSNLQWQVWPDTADRLFVFDQNETMRRPDHAFEKCFYERSLLLLFAELFQSAVFLHDRLEAESGLNNMYCCSPANHYPGGNFLSSLCMVAQANSERLTLCRFNLNPLSELSPPPIFNTPRLCGGGWTNPLEAAQLSRALNDEEPIRLDCDCFLRLGALFHHGRFESQKRRETWGRWDRSANFELCWLKNKFSNVGFMDE